MSGTLVASTINAGASASLLLQSNNTTALTLDTSQNVTAVGTVAMASSFKRNRIINGNLMIWQRGTSGFTTANNYCADRWFVSTAGTLTAVAQSTDVPSGAFPYSLSVAGTNVPQFYQRIESVNSYDLSGQSVTVSFWAKQTTGAGASSLQLSLYYPTATNNYASVTQIGTTQGFTGTSSWAQYTATFSSVPSGVANGLQFVLYSNVGGSSTTLLTGVQLEVGTKATPYEMQIYSDQLAQCQRYYTTVNASLGGVATSGIGNLYNGAFNVTMRSTPTIVVTSSNNVNTTGATILTVNSTYYQHYSLGSASGGFISGAIATASAEL